MNIFIHLVTLFIFVYILLMLNIPHIDSNNHIMMKLYIFAGIFIFELVVALITTMYRKCIINIGKIFRNSLLAALIGVVAYSIYNDLVWKNSSLTAKHENAKIRNLIITILITAFIAIVYFMEIAVTNKTPGINDCLNNIYAAKKT